MCSRHPQGKVTQRTIAREANVSQTLVSLVLSGRAVEVGEATRAQILETARRLGYKARKKAPGGGGRQHIFAYIRVPVKRGHHQEHWVYDSYEQYYSIFQHHLSNACLEHGYSLIVRDDASASSLQHWLEEWNVDGVFWHSSNLELVNWIASRHPTVQVNRHHVINADAVSLNQEELIIIPLEYLRQLGHERILVFAFNQAMEDALRRYRGVAYEGWIKEHGFPHWHQFVPAELVEKLSGANATSAFDYKEQMILAALALPAEERPTAVFSADHDCLVLMKRLGERGFSFPRDLSFVGIDNISASALVNPALTSLDNKLHDLAITCVDTMLKRIQNPSTPFVKTFTTPELVIRTSALPVEQSGAGGAKLAGRSGVVALP